MKKKQIVSPCCHLIVPSTYITSSTGLSTVASQARGSGFQSTNGYMPSFSLLTFCVHFLFSLVIYFPMHLHVHTYTHTHSRTHVCMQYTPAPILSATLYTHTHAQCTTTCFHISSTQHQHQTQTNMYNIYIHYHHHTVQLALVVFFMPTRPFIY